MARAAALLFAVAFQLFATDASEHWQQAQVAMRNANYAQAEAHYRKFLALSPDTPEAYVNLGLALHQQKKPKEAITAFEKALHLSPRLTHAYLFLEIDRFSLGETGGAIKALQTYIKAASTDPQGHYYLGLAFAERGDVERAMRSFESAAQLAPKDVDILYHLAQAYINEANAMIRRAAEYDRKLPLLKEWEKSQKQGMPDLIRQSPVATAGKETLAKLKPRLGRRPPDMEAEQIAALAYANLYLETTRKFCEIEPDSFRVHQLLAAYYEKTDQTEKAIEELQVAIQQNPHVRGLHFALGAIYRDQMKFELARDQFLEELKLGSPEPTSRLQLAQMYLFLEQPERALSELQLFRKQFGEKNGLFLKTLAKTYTTLGDHQKAIESYEKAIELGEGDRALYYQLGQAYRKVGRTELARKMFDLSNKSAQAQFASEQLKIEKAIEAQRKGSRPQK